MNDLSVCAADIGNAFLCGKTSERCYIIAGPEFGELEGQPLITQKGLCGLRTSSARFHEHCSARLRNLGFKPSKPDADFWMKRVGDHYEHIATCVDDVTVCSKDPMCIINELKKEHILKGVGEPECYLGGNVEQLDDAWREDGVTTALSAQTYCQNVVQKFEEMFNAELRTFKTPMSDTCHPELDDSPVLDTKDASRFRAIIGSANWAITLGRLDINYATMALSRYNMEPRQGHLQAAKRIFGYLKKLPKGKIVVDPTYPDHSQCDVNEYNNWKEFYPDAKEEIPDKKPEPLGKPAVMTLCVDADHAHDKLTRRLVTGVVMLINNTPIKWISKRQKTVETSTCGSELVATRIAVDLVIEHRHTLRMLGAPVAGTCTDVGRQ